MLKKYINRLVEKEVSKQLGKDRRETLDYVDRILDFVFVDGMYGSVDYLRYKESLYNKIEKVVEHKYQRSFDIAQEKFMNNVKKEDFIRDIVNRINILQLSGN